MNKKVIFIAGADHSGSTMVGCVLGANENGFKYFHVGEIYPYFNKNHKNFGKINAARYSKYSYIWNNIRRFQSDMKPLYSAIPIQFFVIKLNH